MSDKKMPSKSMTHAGMSHDDQMAMMDKMSIEDKAAMFKQVEREGQDGRDENGRSRHGQNVLSGKNGDDDDEDVGSGKGMIDKMPMDKRMAMMHKGSMMKGSGKKMDKMDTEKMLAKP